MELLSVTTARTLWFFEANDTNPRGLDLSLTVFPALIQKYNFANHPTREDLYKPNREPGEKFIGGSFVNSEGRNITIHLTTFDDGFVAETRSSTRDSEDFLTELTQWMVKDFGLTFRPDMIRRRGYVSELFVKSDYHVTGLTSELQRFADKLSTFISGPDGPILYEPSGISFAPNTSTALKPASLIFERAADASFSENRYFSKAPVQTDIHLELLNELEQILR